MADQLYVVTFKNGIAVDKQVFFGDTSKVIAQLEDQKTADKSFSYQVFPVEDDPGFKNAPLPPTLPPTQDQLNAIWRGGTEMEAMRLKVIGIIGPQAVTANAK